MKKVQKPPSVVPRASQNRNSTNQGRISVDRPIPNKVVKQNDSKPHVIEKNGAGDAKVVKLNVEKSEFNEFPDELITRLLYYVSFSDMLSIQSVCLRWYQLANTNILWKPLCAANQLLKFDKQIDLSTYKSMEVGRSPSGLSPEIPEEYFNGMYSLGEPCHWKKVFIRGHWLQSNWMKGRYSVGPVRCDHNARITCLDSDGFIVATGAEDKLVHVYDLPTAQLLYTLTDHPETVTGLKIVNGMIMSSCIDGLIRIFDAEYGILQSSMDCKNPIEMMKIDGDIAAVVCANGHLQLWDLASQSLTQDFGLHTDEVTSLVFSHKYILTSSWDARVCVVNKRRATVDANFQHGQEGILCCANPPGDQDLVCTGSAEGIVRIWSINSEKKLKEWVAHVDSEIFCMASVGKFIATGGTDSRVALWDLDGKLLQEHSEHVGAVRTIYFDAARLISTGDQKKIVHWDWQHQKLSHHMYRQPILVNLVFINETRLITASPEKAGKIAFVSYW